MGFTYRKHGLTVNLSSRGLRISKVGGMSFNHVCYFEGSHDGKTTTRFIAGGNGFQYMEDSML